MAPVEAGKQLFQEYWPEASGVADPERYFYVAFDRRRMRWWEMFHPRMWLHGIRALRKGNRQGRVVGDPWTMPGAFLVRGDRVLYEHVFRDGGDHPDFAALPAMAQEKQGG